MQKPTSQGKLFMIFPVTNNCFKYRETNHRKLFVFKNQTYFSKSLIPMIISSISDVMPNKYFFWFRHIFLSITFNSCDNSCLLNIHTEVWIKTNGRSLLLTPIALKSST